MAKMKNVVDKILEVEASDAPYRTTLPKKNVDLEGHEIEVRNILRLQGEWLANAEDIYVSRVDCVVTWSADIEARSWGIKSVDVVIQSVNLTAHIEVLEDDRSHPVELVIDSVKDGYTVVVENANVMPLFPKTALVQIDKKKIFLDFSVV